MFWYTTTVPAPPSCPRCGYDLSGAMAAWTLTCPLTHTCSECGLFFELRAIFNERFRNRAQFFEPTPTRAAFFKTARMALRPWRFWRWAAMEHEIRPRPMLAGALLSALLIE